MNADLRESVARAIMQAEFGDGGQITLTPAAFRNADRLASAALRAIADAGPSEKMVEAAARVLRDSDPLTDTEHRNVARSALSAALKEMG